MQKTKAYKYMYQLNKFLKNVEVVGKKNPNIIRYYSLNLTWFSPLSVTAFPALTSLYLFRTLALATLSYDDAHNIVTTCTNLKRLALDCDFYGRAIRHIISSLAPTLEVNMKTTKKLICFREFFLEVVKK